MGQAVEVFYPLSMRICNAVIVLVCTYVRPSGAARRRTRECWTLKLRTRTGPGGDLELDRRQAIGLLGLTTCCMRIARRCWYGANSDSIAQPVHIFQLIAWCPFAAAASGNSRVWEGFGTSDFSQLFVGIIVRPELAYLAKLPTRRVLASLRCCVAQPPVLLHIKQKWWTSNQWIKQQIVAGKARPLAGLHRPPAVVPEELPS